MQRVLNQRGQCLKGAEVLILGVTYKADISDPRESPATKVMELLQQEKATLTYTDPFAPSVSILGEQYKSQELTPDLLAKCSCALILTAHSAFDYDMIVEKAPVVFDTRNGTRNVQQHRERIVLLS